MIKEKIDANYADLSYEIILTAKPLYYQSLGDWENFCESVSLYAADKKRSDTQLDAYARTIFLFCDDQKYIRTAIGWCTQILSNSDERAIQFLKTYSYLLYKSGQKELAIKSMKQFIEFSTVSSVTEEATKELEKMKNNEKI